MLDALLTLIAFICLASLCFLITASLIVVVGWWGDRRWQREYERELKLAEQILAADLERWRWVEAFEAAAPSRKRPSESGLVE